jgi:hypothetical protein
MSRSGGGRRDWGRGYRDVADADDCVCQCVCRVRGYSCLGEAED